MLARKKKRREPEYLLRVFHHLDNRTKRNTVVFQVETLKIFKHFNYEVLINDRMEHALIELNILGIHAPLMVMPGTGPAKGRKEYSNLRGTYTVRVAKPNRVSEVLRIRFTKNSITIVEPPPKGFLLVSADSMEITE